MMVFNNNWQTFWGGPGLNKRDGIHHTWEGAAYVFRIMARFISQANITRKQSINFHPYADDTVILINGCHYLANLQTCFKVIKNQMSHNLLLLNSEKNERSCLLTHM